MTLVQGKAQVSSGVWDPEHSGETALSPTHLNSREREAETGYQAAFLDAHAA